MKTAISVPDQVFERAERTAKRLGKSRSQLYSEAVEEYVARHDPGEITQAMDRVCEALETQPDRLVATAAHQVLKNTEW